MKHVQTTGEEVSNKAKDAIQKLSFCERNLQVSAPTLLQLLRKKVELLLYFKCTVMWN